MTVPCGRTCNSSVRSCSRVGPGHPIDVSSLGGGQVLALTLRGWIVYKWMYIPSVVISGTQPGLRIRGVGHNNEVSYGGLLGSNPNAHMCIFQINIGQKYRSVSGVVLEGIGNEAP